jgi:hypothetical protein
MAERPGQSCSSGQDAENLGLRHVTFEQETPMRRRVPALCLRRPRPQGLRHRLRVLVLERASLKLYLSSGEETGGRTKVLLSNPVHLLLPEADYVVEVPCPVLSSAVQSCPLP